MPTMNLRTRTTRAAFLNPMPPKTPFRDGEIPAAWHTFEDFDIPRTYALISPVNEYGMRFAYVYTPNPWYRDEIRMYEWTLGHEGIWYRSKGRTCDIETARIDYVKVKAMGWTPQDVIAKPLNGSLYLGATWDEWSCHFSGMTQQFYSIIPVYKNTYPRKAV